MCTHLLSALICKNVPGCRHPSPGPWLCLFPLHHSSHSAEFHVFRTFLPYPGSWSIILSDGSASSLEHQWSWSLFCSIKKIILPYVPELLRTRNWKPKCLKFQVCFNLDVTQCLVAGTMRIPSITSQYSPPHAESKSQWFSAWRLSFCLWTEQARASLFPCLWNCLQPMMNGELVPNDLSFLILHLR